MRSCFSVVVVCSFVSGCWCLGFDPEFLQTENEKLEKALTNDDADALADLCYDPEEGGACNGYVRLPAPGVPEKACSALRTTVVGQRERAVTKAVEQRDRSTLARICRNDQIYKSVTNDELGLTPTAQRACEAEAKVGIAIFEDAAAEAVKLGGARCLAKLSSTWAELARDGVWAQQEKTKEAQQQTFASTSSSCITQIEERTNDDAALFAMFMEAEAERLNSGEHLDDAGNARVKAAIKLMPERTITKLVQEAEKHKDAGPRALLFASAAAVARRYHDPRIGDLLRSARAEVEREGTKETLTVSLTATGTADDVVRAVSRSLGQGLVHADRGEIALAIELSEPTLDASSEGVSLSATVREQQGMKDNPEFTKMVAKCEKYEKVVADKAQYCAENPRLSNCKLYQWDVELCQRDLNKIKPQVPAFREVSVPYSGTRYQGSARGTLTIRRDGGRTSSHEVSASDSRVAHEAVPRANVSGASARPYGRDELADLYMASARGVVAKYLSDIVNTRAARLLDDVKAAKTKEERMTAVVRYAVVAKAVPRLDLNGALGMPVAGGVDLIAKGVR